MLVVGYSREKEKSLSGVEKTLEGRVEEGLRDRAAMFCHVEDLRLSFSIRFLGYHSQDVRLDVPVTDMLVSVWHVSMGWTHHRALKCRMFLIIKRYPNDLWLQDQTSKLQLQVIGACWVHPVSLVYLFLYTLIR